MASDKSDALADQGVEKIGGEGLVTLRSWLAERHGRYVKFMTRIITQDDCGDHVSRKKKSGTKNGS